jgi:hypothetical protein
MQRFLTITLVAAMGVMSLAAADPLSDEARQAWNRTSGNMVKAAEKMPAENYTFKPAPESQSFGDLVAHTANSAMGTCSGMSGERRRAGVDGSATKDAMVAAIKAAATECEKAYGALTDANALEMIAGRRGSRSRLGTLYGNTIHIEHEYAQMAVHMRLKGIVPPSSEGR